MRVRLVMLASLFISLGIMWAYIVGTFLPWRISCYVCTAPSVVGFIAMACVPESPYYLMLKGRKEDANSALRWLRGPGYDISEEKSEIEQKLVSMAGKKIKLFSELWTTSLRRPFLIVALLMTVQQGCGASILMAYTGMIFESAGDGEHHSNMTVIYTGLVQIVGTVVSIFLIDRIRRRTLMLVSATLTGTLTIVLGAYCYYVYTVEGPKQETLLSWVVLLLGLGCLLAYSLGCRAIPWLYNSTIRTPASTVCIFYNRCLYFVVVQVTAYFGTTG